MENVILIVLLTAAVAVGIWYTIRHFKGEGGCCGGGSKPVKAKKKTLKNPKIGEKVIQIEGMHCDHCRQSVTSALNRLDGVAAKVNLDQKRAVVSYDREISDRALTKAVEDAGFHVISIHEKQKNS